MDKYLHPFSGTMKRMKNTFFFTLSELLSALGEVVEGSFPYPVWVVAEIGDLRFDQAGHCYLELVEKKGDELSARMRGIIWSSLYPTLSSAFLSLTGQSLAKGMEVLLLVRVRFHPVYGLSLDVRNIDPQYSLGAMMRHKREALLRLEQEGLIDQNRNLPFPLIPQRLAVLSSPYAAGFEDFIAHLRENPYGFCFLVELFPAFVQGESVETSFLAVLEEVRKKVENFDVLVILRGGGAQSDLHWFDSYTLGRAIATFPLPVLVGIGHRRDETVLDRVAHRSLKTPTAVADFLVERMKELDEYLLEITRSLAQSAESLLKDQKEKFFGLSVSLERSVKDFLQREREELTHIHWQLKTQTMNVLHEASHPPKETWQRLQETLRWFFFKEHNLLNNISQNLVLLDPRRVLKRGYTLTLQGGKILKSARECNPQKVLNTLLFDGRAESEVKGVEFREPFIPEGS